MYKRYSLLVILLISLISLYIVRTYRWNGEGDKNWKTIIQTTDEKGYYEYLPSLLIRHDLDKPDPQQSFLREQNSKLVIKYPIGVSILWFPFFEAGKVWAKAGAYEQNGYSEPYIKMISIAALFYLVLGLLAIRGILIQFKISDLIICAILILLPFGTNLGYFAMIKQSMSHVYSFAMIACFVYCSLKYFETFKFSYLIGTAISLALTILIRPTNGIVLLVIPFAAGSPDLLRKMLTSWRQLGSAALVFILLISFQLFAWHYQCGKWFVWSYKGEGFYFLHPEIINVLFSYRKGFFLYTPLALLALSGFVPLYKTNRIQFHSLLAALFVALYTISSWWCWSYQDSFGSRPLIDYYALFAILLAFALNNFASTIAKTILGILCALCLLLNLIQSYQYYKGILHPFCMTKEKYWYVFCKTEDQYINCLGGNIDLIPYTKSPAELIHSYSNDYEKEQTNFTNGKLSNMSFCGQPQLHCCHYSTQDEYGTALTINPDSLMISPNNQTHENLFLTASLKRYEPIANSSSDALFVIDISAADHSEYYYTVPMNDTPSETAGIWRTYQYAFEIPKPKTRNSLIHIYIWNKAKKEFYIDDFNVKVYRLFQ